MKKIVKVNYLLIILLYGFSLNAQDKTKPLEISIGTIKTDLKQNAINFGLTYLKSLDSLWAKQDFLFSNNKSVFLFTPDISINTGNSDAFSSISTKLNALLILFNTKSDNGVVSPNPKKTFHTFPFSIGIETNNKFNTINGIVEGGWIPFQDASRTPDFLKRTKLGLFIQGGYKFSVDTTGKQAVGGEIDQSKEKTNNAIFRIKGSFKINTKPLHLNDEVRVGLVGSADGWYNFLNSEIYYSIQGKLRLYLSDSNDKFFDFQYHKGSGAPNFNQGDQFGLGLTVTF